MIEPLLSDFQIVVKLIQWIMFYFKKKNQIL